MMFDLSNLNQLHVVGSTFGSCASEMDEQPHGYRWLEDRATHGRFRLLRIDRQTQETVGDPSLNRLKDRLEQYGVCFWRDVHSIAAIAAGAMDLFVRVWPDELDFDRIDGRCVMVALDHPGNATTQAELAAAPTRVQESSLLRAVEQSPGNLQDWLRAVFAPNDRHIDLFNAESNNRRIVTTISHGSRQVRVFERHPDMTARIRRLAAVVQNSDNHCGVLYCMYKLDENRHMVPRYFGIANWRRKDCQGMSANYHGVANSGGNAHFVRWGYGDYWHIGRLSNAALRGGSAHAHWVPDLFAYNPPLPLTPPFCLNEPVYWAGVPWPCPSGSLTKGDPSTGTPSCIDWLGHRRTLEEIEKELIASCPNLLNINRGNSRCSRALCGRNVPCPCPQA
jgi:hypothetical protein